MKMWVSKRRFEFEDMAPGAVHGPLYRPPFMRCWTISILAVLAEASHVQCQQACDTPADRSRAERLPRTVRFSIRVVSSNRGTDDFTRDH